VSNSEEEHGLP